jgi:hypothetical protein
MDYKSAFRDFLRQAACRNQRPLTADNPGQRPAGVLADGLGENRNQVITLWNGEVITLMSDQKPVWKW